MIAQKIKNEMTILPSSPALGYISKEMESKLLTYGTTWIDLKGIRLSEKRRSQKVTVLMIPFLELEYLQNENQLQS